MDILSFFGSPQEFVKKVLSKTGWTGKHNGKSLDAVAKVDCGLNVAKQRLWFSANFTEDGTPHKLMGSCPVAEPGTQGGDDVITLDQTDVGNDDVVVGIQGKWFPPSAFLVLTYKFDTAEGHQRYEFKSKIV